MQASLRLFSRKSIRIGSRVALFRPGSLHQQSQIIHPDATSNFLFAATSNPQPAHTLLFFTLSPTGDLAKGDDSSPVNTNQAQYSRSGLMRIPETNQSIISLYVK